MLILDDTKGARVRQLWNLYYHVFIDGESASVLRSQSKKLLELAHSLKNWNEGPYGTTIRFCDSITLEKITKLWALYALEPVQYETYKVTQDMLKDQWQAAKHLQAVKTPGTAFTNDYRVMVQGDDQGWKGKLPLIVSAMVSTCALTEYEDDSCGAVFELKSTPIAQQQFTFMFGMLLNVHRSAVGQKDVFVSRYRPGFQAFVSVDEVATSKPTDGRLSSFPTRRFINTCLVTDVVATIHPLLSSNRNEVESLRFQYAVNSRKVKGLLQNGAIVSSEITTAFTLRLFIGRTHRMDVVLPFPPNAASAKTKIARESLWIEYTAAVQSGAAILRRPDNMIPVHLNEQ